MPIDLRSDTVTRPGPAMREAMAQAEVGDDVWGEDPTVQRLEAEVAARVGMEAGLFVPSGTMGNQIAVRCHTQPGDRILLAESSHVLLYEAGAPAVISGVLPWPIPADRGLLDPAAVEAAIPPDDVHLAPASLVCVENPSNRGGGSVYPVDTLDRLVDLARARGLRLHLDGARLFNAAICLGLPAHRLTRGFDSVCICLSKGLGAPVGSVLCGPGPWIARARRVRKMLGGGMRQSGVLAAAGLYALEHHVDRLADDHARAHRLWEGVRAAGLEAERPETNMVYVRVEGAERAVEQLGRVGVQVAALSASHLRLVVHLDLDDADIEAAIAAFGGLAAG